jgi:hypothetical protein
VIHEVTYEVHPEVHYGLVVRVECDHGVIHEVAYVMHPEVHHVQVVKIICDERGGGRMLVCHQRRFYEMVSGSDGGLRVAVVWF